MTDSLGAPVLTIDGPTASGKGAVAQEVALALRWHYLDSGALYRLVSLIASREGIGYDDEPALARAATMLVVTFDGNRIDLNGENVAQAIRAPMVGNGASQIAALPGVRDALLARQRGFCRRPGLVADGRDMATVVFPDAPLKVYLTADLQIRANRRHKQLIDKGFSTKIDTVLADIAARDDRDMNREVAPLKPARDARILDSTSMDLETVISTVLAMVHELGLSGN